MLVLSRDDGESVLLLVGNITVRVTLLAGRRGLARLGFVAPPEVQVLREELLASNRGVQVAEEVEL